MLAVGGVAVPDAVKRSPPSWPSPPRGEYRSSAESWAETDGPVSTSGTAMHDQRHYSHVHLRHKRARRLSIPEQVESILGPDHSPPDSPDPPEPSIPPPSRAARLAMWACVLVVGACPWAALILSVGRLAGWW
jgi:hypothetical protein